MKVAEVGEESCFCASSDSLVQMKEAVTQAEQAQEIAERSEAAMSQQLTRMQASLCSAGSLVALSFALVGS